MTANREITFLNQLPCTSALNLLHLAVTENNQNQLNGKFHLYLENIAILI